MSSRFRIPGFASRVWIRPSAGATYPPGADEGRQCRITIADHRYRSIFLPALIGQGGADQYRWMLCRAADEREPPGWASPDLNLAGDRLEMPDLIPRHGVDMGTVQGDQIWSTPG